MGNYLFHHRFAEKQNWKKYEKAKIQTILF